MPLFEYKCNDCDNIWEEFRKTQQDPETCPECLKTDIKRLISKSNFVLKGNGWYQTDFKTKK